jgi:putative thiamine transport system permease protein
MNRTRATPSLLLAVVGVPLVWSLWGAIAAGFDWAAWQALWHDPQTWRALCMSLWTGLMASGLSVALAAWLLSRHFPGPGWARLLRFLSPMLAVPHAAFAIGLAFLIAPSGWLLRALSPWATGFDAPPPWLTTQDPWGLGLIAVLVLKEVPFLLWTAATQLQRADVAQRWTRELQVARSLGYGPRVAWWRVVWPQLWPRLRWPMLAVLAYSLTVVDMALLIGPTSPPTLAVLAWKALLDSDVAVNAQGAASAWLLAGLSVGVVGLLWPLPRLAFWRERWTDGERGNHRRQPAHTSALGFYSLLGIYLAVMLALAVGSVSGIWAFPALLPQTLSLQAWSAVAGSFSTVTTTLTLAFSSALAALLWSVAWLEYAPPAWDRRLRPLLYLPLVLPPVLWVIGLHAMALNLGLDARWSGVWLAHTLAAVPYVLIALSPAYTGFDARYQHITASLGHGRAVFLWRVKWPLLRAALAASLAIGFAVSVAQYLPTLFVGAGRFASVTTEAVTLASGAQRSLTSAYAWLQWALPAGLFGLAAWLGKPRRF